MAGKSVSIPARSSEPYLHLDERALVMCDGPRVVVFEQAVLRWVAETLAVIAEEGRATRTQGDRVLGGWVGDDGSVRVYAGTRGGESVALEIDRAGFDQLRTALPARS